MQRISRPLSALVALTLVTFSLAGCVKLDTQLTISADDTVDGTAIVAIDKSLLTMGGQDPDAAFKKAEGSIDNLPEGTSTEKYDDGQFYGQKITFVDVPLSEFNTGEAGAPVITHANGRYTFVLDLDSNELERTGADLAMLQPFLNSMRIRFQITFPGKVIENNGVLNGQTVTWDVRIGKDTQLRAVSEEPTLFPGWIWLAGAGCLLALLVIAGIVFLAFRLNRKPAELPAPDEPAHS